jgi:RNA recognition motif-containing protein
VPKEETAAVEATQAEEFETQDAAEDTAGGGTGNDGDDDPPAGDGERGRRVYVGNLAWEVSWQDLKDHMKTTGLDAVRANIMQTPDGRSKGCGIVEFATPEGAEQAVLTLNDTELHGRQIFVREDREDGRPSASFSQSGAGGGGAGGGGGQRFSAGEQSQSRRVYVGNLSWDVAWQDLKDHMRQAGEVLHAEVIMELNGRSKGCGIVEFATDEAALEAITVLTDTELKGRMIFVREDRETSSQGGHPGGAGGRMQNTSVYVWNLAPETSWQDLKDHMRKAGNVDSATIMSNPAGESIGCGIVVFQKAQEASRAIRELQNSEVHGRPMFLRKDRAQAGRGGGRGFGSGRGSGRGYGGRGRGRGGGGR